MDSSQAAQFAAEYANVYVICYQRYSGDCHADITVIFSQTGGYCFNAGAGTSDFAPVHPKGNTAQLSNITVIFLYDQAITTAEDVRCFWGRRVTGAAVLFWLNKYVTILDMVWGLETFANPFSKVSSAFIEQALAHFSHMQFFTSEVS